MSARIRRRGNRYVTTIYIRGQRHWISAPTRPELEAKLSHALIERQRAERHSEAADTFAARWTTDYPRHKESTNAQNAYNVRKFARDYAGVLLCDITRQDARAWALQNRSYWKSVRAMFTDAVRDGLADANPFLGLRLQATSRGRKDLVAPTEQDVERLAEVACEVHGDYGVRVYSNMILTAAYTGLRPAELYALRWEDIDWTGSSVRVERQFNWRLGKTTAPKNDQARVIPLLAVAHRALRSTPRQRDEVFFTPRGAQFSGRVAHYYFHPVRCAFGRPDLDWYDLRHAFGTMLANHGVTPYDIALAMGHRDGGKLAMTTYIHTTESDARAHIAAAFGQNVVDLGTVKDRKAAGE